ncbi:scavenger receptor class B member 1-like [Dermacentor andersoni]|uniref:scavenger receptor class B member 1-like n=1 Tax=Dermacentor andersoni TaxID=34620 RepID=UPI002155E065|nr:scavenger receptor class B member 1-like [Dermacentor andersoni]XP_054929490.1 scavenger receptor class B member 1-like [Dermacentor andersoni]XP_054929491.1 scavenger receptor class B member 1-like [Dermacentor andersoni]XP_054929492.1 scavenger receptor class B member 1-like [Dermacentor andersoni]
MFSKKTGICCGAFSLIVAIFSVFVLIEFDDFYGDLLNKQVAITPGSTAFSVWKDVGSCFDMSANLYFFNITNVEAVKAGRANPRLRQMGPYSYRIEWLKDNITFNDNGTVSFLEKMIFHFDEENSAGTEDDLVTTVNVPFIATQHLLSGQSLLLRSVGRMLLSSLSQELYLTRSVRELSFEGYPDVLMMLAAVARGGADGNAAGGAGGIDIVSVFRKGYRTLVDTLKNQPQDAAGRFAYMAGRNDTFHELLTMYTGEGDICRINHLDSINGKRQLGIWEDEVCDKVRGSFGNVRPPLSTSSSETVFIPDLKRTFELHHVADSKVGGLGTRRFAVTSDVFNKRLPENACYNAARKDLPSGLADLGPLQDGVPVVMSLPHFLYGSSSLYKGVDGLYPDEEQHLFYIDSEPTTGASISGRVRLQLNVLIKDIPGFWSSSELGYTVLPLFWQEVVAEAQEHTLTRIRVAVLAPILVRCTAIFLLVASVILLLVSFISLLRSRRSRRRVVSEPSKAPRDKVSIYLNGGSFLASRDNNNGLVKNGAVPAALAQDVPEADALLLQSTAV